MSKLDSSYETLKPYNSVRIQDYTESQEYLDNMKWSTGLAKHFKQLVREVLIEEGVINGKKESEES